VTLPVSTGVRSAQEQAPGSFAVIRTLMWREVLEKHKRGERE
jgi:hypothetical protein